MSANRAVQAAQRRRAGGPEPVAPGRGPQPSINSSQMFAQGQQQQVRPVTTGRLAGQQANLQQQQQQMQQQLKQQMQQEPPAGITGVNKMTLAQAITLITLRLGKVETHLNEREVSQFSNSGLDSGIIDVIMSRLDALESAPQTSSAPNNTSSNSLEVSALKQNVEILKNTLGQYKTNITVLTNEQKGLRQEVESLKSELASLQSFTMEHNKQITQLSLAVNLDADTNVDNAVEYAEEEEEEDVDETSNEIVGTDLKELIEKELNI